MQAYIRWRMNIRRVICGNIVGRHVAAEAPINYPASAVAIYLFHRCQQEDNQQPLSSSQGVLKVLQIQFLTKFIYAL